MLWFLAAGQAMRSCLILRESRCLQIQRHHISHSVSISRAVSDAISNDMETKPFSHGLLNSQKIAVQIRPLSQIWEEKLLDCRLRIWFFTKSVTIVQFYVASNFARDGQATRFSFSKMKFENFKQSKWSKLFRIKKITSVNFKRTFSLKTSYQ